VRLRRELCAWFAREQRDLPWRHSRDPYAIWISEAMLQQTRVEAVVPYFRRFLARFPDVESLAEAREEEVLALWSGLGYYSRARALRAAARELVARHAGRLPRTKEGLLALPGVGPYTAGAVLSIAYSASEPVVDGNVQRVFARLFALEAASGSPALVQRCWELAAELVPPHGDALDPGQWNQALMELGARVCTARAPACGACPVRNECRAHATRRVEELPRPKARRAPVTVELEIAVVRRADGCWLLERRPPTGRMAGLFEFPTRERVEGGGKARLWPTQFDYALTLAESMFVLTHAITHHRIRANVHSARSNATELPAAHWAERSELATLALTGLARKVVRGLGGGA
jgi:A/G-specific adenine glycosylase